MKPARTMFRVAMQLDNSAFMGDRIDRAMEVARVLRELANRIADDATLNHPLHDRNGNTVGASVVKVERR